MPCGCASKAKQNEQAQQAQQVAESRRQDLVIAREQQAKAQAVLNAQKKAS